jgi:hypothetical protein
MSNIGGRYREFMAASGGPEGARRRIVECARRHGTMAAARMSGASRWTVRNLVIRADAGDDLARNAGRQPMGARDEARIVAVKRAHPTESAVTLKNKRGLPFGLKRIMRVLGEAGMLRKRRNPTRDPDFWIRICTGRVWIAEQELKVAGWARAAGMTGHLAQVERIQRRVEVAKRKLEWWKSEKVRRERAEKMEGH